VIGAGGPLSYVAQPVDRFADLLAGGRADPGGARPDAGGGGGGGGSDGGGGGDASKRGDVGERGMFRCLDRHRVLPVYHWPSSIGSASMRSVIHRYIGVNRRFHECFMTWLNRCKFHGRPALIKLQIPWSGGVCIVS